MDTVYLVDLENVGTKLLCEYTNQFNPDTEFIIFYSDNTTSPGTILESILPSVKVSFIDCHAGGNNAMDFCICAMAGKLAATGIMIRILSNDKGYDSMIRMLHDQGIRINRVGTYQPVSNATEAEQSEHQFVKENSALIGAIKKQVPRQYQNEVLKTLPDAVSRKEAHEMLQAILPQGMVSGIYKKLKKHIPKEVI